jgi:hypothetical protein
VRAPFLECPGYSGQKKADRTVPWNDPAGKWFPVGLVAALVAGLAFVTAQSITLVAGLAFIAELAGRIAGSYTFFQFFDLQLDFLFHWIWSFVSRYRNRPAETHSVVEVRFVPVQIYKHSRGGLGN